MSPEPTLDIEENNSVTSSDPIIEPKSTKISKLSSQHSSRNRPVVTPSQKSTKMRSGREPEDEISQKSQVSPKTSSKPQSPPVSKTSKQPSKPAKRKNSKNPKNTTNPDQTSQSKNPKNPEENRNMENHEETQMRNNHQNEEFTKEEEVVEEKTSVYNESAREEESEGDGESDEEEGEERMVMDSEGEEMEGDEELEGEGEDGEESTESEQDSEDTRRYEKRGGNLKENEYNKVSVELAKKEMKKMVEGVDQKYGEVTAKLSDALNDILNDPTTQNIKNSVLQEITDRKQAISALNERFEKNLSGLEKSLAEFDHVTKKFKREKSDLLILKNSLKSDIEKVDQKNDDAIVAIRNLAWFSAQMLEFI